jgi:hypothetical protein
MKTLPDSHLLAQQVLEPFKEVVRCRVLGPAPMDALGLPQHPEVIIVHTHPGSLDAWYLEPLAV